LFSPPQIASEASPGDEKQAREPAAGEPQQVASLPQDEKAVAAEALPDTPRFDILRVEPDGSVVVAGSALPDSAVEILSEGKVVATGRAGASGDFAIVFDEPLPPGNHELLIRSIPDQGEPVLSAETGIVSVPEAGNKGGEVLAMVSRDGAASRILQAPGDEPEKVAEPAEPL
ncbi:MAG: peptidoglycan-binding protein LysM, partial [Nitratireductor sp.]|nr:peptidoglycan-binding protein LysM [Nitratireductor sp.]